MCDRNLDGAIGARVTGLTEALTVFANTVPRAIVRAVHDLSTVKSCVPRIAKAHPVGAQPIRRAAIRAVKLDRVLRRSSGSRAPAAETRVEWPSEAMSSSSSRSSSSCPMSEDPSLRPNEAMGEDDVCACADWASSLKRG